MTRRFVFVALCGLLLSVAVPPAQARQKPTNRARIHALEKKVDRLEDQLADTQADVDALLNRMLVVERQAASTQARLEGCFFGWPMQTVSVTPFGAVESVQVFALNAATPGAWMASINAGCLNTGATANGARALAG